MRPFAAMTFEMISLASAGIRGIATGTWDMGSDLLHHSGRPAPATRDALLALWDETTSQIDTLWPQIPPQRFEEVDTAFGAYEGVIYGLFLYLDRQRDPPSWAGVRLLALAGDRTARVLRPKLTPMTPGFTCVDHPQRYIPNRMSAPCVALGLLCFLSACARSSPEPVYDMLITGGSVLDGNGTPAVKADIGIGDGKIVRIGNLTSARANRRIDATGLTVAPGFIDIHNHSDFTILREPKAESMIRQGVTTMVLGESRSAGPVKPGEAALHAPTARRRTGRRSADTSRLERQRMATNIASYVGEEQVWTYVKGYDQTPATPAEIDAMKALVARRWSRARWGCRRPC